MGRGPGVAVKVSDFVSVLRGGWRVWGSVRRGCVLGRPSWRGQEVGGGGEGGDLRLPASARRVGVSSLGLGTGPAGGWGQCVWSACGGRFRPKEVILPQAQGEGSAGGPVCTG